MRRDSIRPRSNGDSADLPELPSPVDGGPDIQHRYMDAKGGAGLADRHDDGSQFGVVSWVGQLGRRVAASTFHDDWRGVRGPTRPASHDSGVAGHPDAGGAIARSAD